MIRGDMRLLARIHLPYVLIAIGFAVPGLAAVIYSFGVTGAPRTLPPGWLVVARFGLPLSVSTGLIGVVLAWRSGLVTGPIRAALFLVLAALLLVTGAMFFV